MAYTCGQRLGPDRRSLVAKANLAGALGRAELDVGNFRCWHADVVAALVGDPQHVARSGERRLNTRLQIVAICVVGEFEVDLTRGLGYSDAYVHTVRLQATRSCLLRRDAYLAYLAYLTGLLD
jgi:hypothetical protein